MFWAVWRPDKVWRARSPITSQDTGKPPKTRFWESPGFCALAPTTHSHCFGLHLPANPSVHQQAFPEQTSSCLLSLASASLPRWPSTCWRGSQLPGPSLPVSSGCGPRAHVTLHSARAHPKPRTHSTLDMMLLCLSVSTGVPARKGAGRIFHHTWMYSCSTARILWARRNLRTRPMPQSNPKDTFLRLEDKKETGPWFILEICQEVGLRQWLNYTFRCLV